MKKRIRPYYDVACGLLLFVVLCGAPDVWADTSDQRQGEASLSIVCSPVEGFLPGDKVGPIVMTRMELPHILNLLQTFSGRTIIPGAGLPSLRLTFRTQDELRRDEAILVIETLLRLNGVLLIKGEADFVEARPQGQALTSGPVLLDADRPGELDGQQVYGRVFNLQHVTSGAVFPQVRGMLSPGGLSSIANLAWRDAIMVFDTRRNLETVARVVEMLDQPVDRQADVFVVPARNSTVQNLHQALVHAQRQQASPALNRASFQINRQANHLVVVAPREHRAYIEELAKLLDADIAPMTTSRVIPVRYGNIRSLYGIVNGIVRHQQRTWDRAGIRSPEAPGSSGSEATSPGVVAGAEVTGIPEGEVVTVPPPVPAGEVVAELQQSAQDLQFSPYMSIWLDLANNAIVAYGTYADIARAEALIADLDRETAPLLISEVITLNHAFAPTIGGLISRMIQTQRNIFRQEQLGRTDSRREAESLRGADAAAEAEAAFDFSPFMTIFTEQAGNALVVYGTRADIEKIKPLISQLDREYAPVTAGKTVTIKHTQAASVATTLQRIISMQQLAFRRQGIRTDAPRSRDPVELADATDADSSFSFTPYAMVHADRTTNAIFLYGTMQDMQRMEVLVAELDRETAPITRSRMFYLRHAGADALSRLISSLVQAQRRTFQQLGLRTPEGDESTAERQIEQAIGFEFSDFAMLIADRRSNGILVYGTDGDIRRIAEIIEKVDVAVEPITMSRIIALRHADANHISRVLQIIVTGQRRVLQRYESEGVDLRDGSGSARAVPAAEGDPALQFSPFLSIVPDARNNALIVYGTHEDVAHVHRLVEQIDVEVAPITISEVFLLQHAQAPQVGAMLMGIINNQRRAMALVQSQFRAVQFRTGTDTHEQDASAMETLFDPGKAMQFSPYVSVVANPRNNSLLGYGTAADIEQLRDLVTKTDIQVAPRTQSRVFVIRHGDANDIVRTLNPLIQAQQRVREREATLRRFSRQQRGDEEKREDVPSSEMGDVYEAQDSLDAMGGDLDRDLQFSPYISLTADTRANTVIAYGTPFDLEQVDYLVNQIDRVLPQVRIEVVIAEVSLSEGQVSGLNSFGFAYDNPFDFQRGGGIIAAGQDGVATVASGMNVDGNGGGEQASPTSPSFIGRGGVIASGPQLDSSSGPALDMGFTIDPFSMRTVFRVAREDRNVRILSAPSITTTHNRPAHINVGEARPIITSSTSSLDRNAATRSEILYRDIGIQLTVRPLISEDGIIQLDIEQVVETVVDTQMIDNNIQPIIGTRRANSFVSVYDQQILVMGGLQSTETTLSEGRVFLLGDIPVLGYLFRPRRRISTVRELIIFIRPELVQSRPVAAAFHSDPAQRRPAEAEALHYYESGTFESDPRGVGGFQPTRLQRLRGRGNRTDGEEARSDEPEISMVPETEDSVLEDSTEDSGEAME